MNGDFCSDIKHNWKIKVLGNCEITWKVSTPKWNKTPVKASTCKKKYPSIREKKNKNKEDIKIMIGSFTHTGLLMHTTLESHQANPLRNGAGLEPGL